MKHETAVSSWQIRMGLTDRAAAELLGMTAANYQRLKLGKTPANHRTLLACAAIERGVDPIKRPAPCSPPACSQSSSACR